MLTVPSLSRRPGLSDTTRCARVSQPRRLSAFADRPISSPTDSQAPKDVVPPGDDPPFSDPAHHQGTHGAGGGGSGGGAMGQGTEEPPKGETMHRVNSRANRQRATSSVGSSGLGGGMGSGGGDGSARQGRDRSGTLAGEGHDHDEGFPEKEREQMEECLEEVLGHLGESCATRVWPSRGTVLLTVRRATRTVIFPTRYEDSFSLYFLARREVVAHSHRFSLSIPQVPRSRRRWRQLLVRSRTTVSSRTRGTNIFFPFACFVGLPRIVSLLSP